MLLITTDDVAFLRDDVLVAAADPTGATRAADLLADDHVTRPVPGAMQRRPPQLERRG